MKIYQISWFPIIAFMVAGFTFLTLCFSDIKGINKHPLVFCIGLLFSLVFLGYSFYLLRKRVQGKGFYWDDDGIVIDLKGNKVFWDEIEDIRFFKGRGGKSTVIYPHYSHHETIRIRHKKFMPTTAHSIEWYLIEKPKEMHKNLMQVWQEREKY